MKKLVRAMTVALFGYSLLNAMEIHNAFAEVNKELDDCLSDFYTASDKKKESEHWSKRYVDMFKGVKRCSNKAADIMERGAKPSELDKIAAREMRGLAAAFGRAIARFEKENDKNIVLELESELVEDTNGDCE